ncbi:acyl-CoA thioesterase [Novosphingobium sp. FSY-8]|uniref:Acyl-CoA thioesterase n=1 Tax=Novosphingobium ovatum TaxID=1908523 RepID=A0ABW9XHG7_9SPHN|nr:acyl-CoA thioesterase [Novosphingobium ovatum]NBC37990.1 acyl-CoA thioesterase [Novosphingobium ovatum]
MDEILAKPDPARLNTALYPHHVVIPTRYGDLDPNAHINNVAMAAIIQDARIRFHADSTFNQKGHGHGVIVASFAIEYLASAQYPAPIDLYAAITRVGRSSFAMVQLAVQDDVPVTYAETTIVWVPDERPEPLPEDFVAGAPKWMIRA